VARTLFERRAVHREQIEEEPTASAHVGTVAGADEKDVGVSPMQGSGIKVGPSRNENLRVAEEGGAAWELAERPELDGIAAVSSTTERQLPEGTAVPAAAASGRTEARAEDPRLSDVVNSTNEEVFRNLLRAEPEQVSTSDNNVGINREAADEIGALSLDTPQSTPNLDPSTSPLGDESSIENTPTLEKPGSAKPGHERKLSLSNSAPLMVTPPGDSTVVIPAAHMGRMVVRSNSTLEARALQRMRQVGHVSMLLFCLSNFCTFSMLPVLSL
jgi:hypothetical protein